MILRYKFFLILFCYYDRMITNRKVYIGWIVKIDMMDVDYNKKMQVSGKRSPITLGTLRLLLLFVV